MPVVLILRFPMKFHGDLIMTDPAYLMKSDTDWQLLLSPCICWESGIFSRRKPEWNLYGR